MIDSEVAYAKLTAHVRECAQCNNPAAIAFGAECPVGHELLRVWGDAAKLADRQAAEYDAAFALDDDSLAHPEDRLEAEA